MSNPSGPEQGEEPTEPTAGAESPTSPDPADGEQAHPDRVAAAAAAETEAFAVSPDDHEPATEVFSSTPPPAGPGNDPQGERRFTAPSGFDAGTTQKIDTPQEPATEVFAAPPGAPGDPTQPKAAAPQMIPPRGEQPRPPQPRNRSWGWVAAVVLVIAALAAIAVLGTLLLTKGGAGSASQEDQVRETIESFDAAVQKGDLATLRSITCGETRDVYVRYDEQAWEDIHAQVEAAKQYPVVASIDQVVVNGDHAEANVTTFMAFAPQTRSTRSFDLQFRDDQWKICQAPTN